MIVLGTGVLTAFSLATLVLAVTLFVEVIASLFYRPPAGGADASPCPPYAVLVPAHDEARMIGATLRTLMRELRAGDRLLVVADNCTDETAAIARAAGAEVIERFDRQRVGKGFALEYGIDHLMLSGTPAVVVFVDADCQTSQGAILALAGAAHVTQGPVQGNYLLTAGAAASMSQRLSVFAIRLKNYVRPLGCRQLGLACPITGSGFALPGCLLHRAKLGTDNIVEDLALGIDLAVAGSPALFTPSATITSPLPPSRRAHVDQRMRWEQGHLATIASSAARVLRHAVIDRDARLLALTLDLCIPPLALLTAAMTAMTAVDVAWLLVAGSELPTAVQLLALLLLSVTIFLTWWRYGRDLLSGVDLFYILAYVLNKIPMYVSIALRRRVGWVRSSRE